MALENVGAESDRLDASPSGRVLGWLWDDAALGTVDGIINEDVLSRLYDRPVDVLRVRGRIVVVAGA